MNGMAMELIGNHIVRNFARQGRCATISLVSQDVLFRLLRGRSDANIRFSALCGLLRGLGFEERIRGDHHIFTRDGVEEILNLQPRGDKAKPYQVAQARSLIIHYGLVEGD